MPTALPTPVRPAMNRRRAAFIIASGLNLTDGTHALGPLPTRSTSSASADCSTVLLNPHLSDLCGSPV